MYTGACMRFFFFSFFFFFFWWQSQTLSPEKSEKGAVINGLEKLTTPVFHMGTKQVDGNIVINGGRVLLVCASGENLQASREKVYHDIGKIGCDDLFFRKDIGHHSF